MKTLYQTITTLVIILTMIQCMVMAQSPAPSPGGPDCFSYLIDSADCLSFVEEGSNLTKPDPNCCPELANLVKTQPVCLCELLGNSSQLGVSVDNKRALELPSLCHVQTPPLNLCAAIGYPVPVAEPAPNPSEGTNNDDSSSSNLDCKQRHLIEISLATLIYFFSKY